MKYRLVIFDFDGTLADSAAWFLKAMNELAGELSFRRIEACDHEILRGLTSAAVMRFLGVPLWKVPRLMRRMRSGAAKDSAQIRLFGGVEGMLQELDEAGILLAVVSSNTEENIRKILGPVNAGRIGHYHCGASLFGKAAKLRGVLRRTGVRPEESIYIGDEIRDATAARVVKMPFGAVAWGYTRIDALRAEKPAMVFDRVDEILPRLKG